MSSDFFYLGVFYCSLNKLYVHFILVKGQMVRLSAYFVSKFECHMSVVCLMLMTPFLVWTMFIWSIIVIGVFDWFWL